MNVSRPNLPGSGTSNWNRPGNSALAKLLSPTTTIGRVKLAVVSVDAILAFFGLFVSLELVVLSLAVVWVAWMMDNLEAFKPRKGDENGFTHAGKIARSLAAFGALIVGAAVYYLPAVSYRAGGGMLTALLAAGTILLALGKALDFKAFVASLTLCAAVGVGALVLPEPPETEPDPTFETGLTTDVTLKFVLRRADGETPGGVGINCAAILPRTWLTAHRSVFLGSAVETFDDGWKAELPYSPLGYVLDVRDETVADGPRFTNVEVTGVLPGQTKDVAVDLPAPGSTR